MDVAPVQIADVFSLITPGVVVFVMLGVTVGVVLGAIPGLTGSIGIAIVLPFTLFLDPLTAVGLLTGVYKGGMFGGAISAIGVGIPGTASSVPTVFDGYPMAQQGKPKTALHIAHYSGIVADVFSDVLLVVSFAFLARLALQFSPREMFALMVVALAVLAVFATGSPGRALIGIGIGMALGTIGADPIAGIPRLDFGLRELRSGVAIIPLIVGLFAIPELTVQWEKLWRQRRERLAKERPAARSAAATSDEDRITIRQWFAYWRETLLGTVLGTFLGVIPGPGAVTASFASYNIAARFRRNRGTFGTGNPAGVAAAESADSATAGATLIPLFGLGIPGSISAALFAAALMMQGITPGPTMVRTNAAFVYAFFILLFIASLWMLGVVHAFIPFYARLVSAPMHIIVPALTVLCVLGVWSIEVRVGAVLLMLACGVLGLVCRRHGIPVGAVILAFIIGPLLETNFRRGMLMSGGDFAWWFSSPLALGFYAGGIVLAVGVVRLLRN